MVIRMEALFRPTLTLVFFLGTASNAAFGERPYFQGLGDLPEGTFASWAHDISRNGRVVVGATPSTGSFSRQAFSWTRESGMVALGDLDGGNPISVAFGISGDGRTIVGGAENGKWEYVEGFRLDVDTGMQGLGDLPGGVDYSSGTAVSADATVIVGESSSEQFPEYSEAFRWTAEGGMVRLGDWPKGRLAYAAAVSADGNVVVGSATSSSGWEAYRWTPADGAQALGKLKNGKGSNAFAISPDGKVIVGEAHTFENGNHAWVPFRWTEETGMVGLLSAKNNRDGNTQAYDVSDDGSVIVGGDRNKNTAIYWTEIAGVRKLKDVLNGYGLDEDLKGWQLHSATGISGDGLTIIGNGLNPHGDPEAWIAHIPEPATAILLFATLLVIGPARRR